MTNEKEKTSNYNLKKFELSKKIKMTLIGLGFDFCLLGSHYIKNVVESVVLNPEKLYSLSTKVMQEMSIVYNHSVKSIDKDIRWAIKKAYNVGSLSKISFFANGNMPTIKQLVNWLFDYFVL